MTSSVSSSVLEYAPPSTSTSTSTTRATHTNTSTNISTNTNTNSIMSNNTSTMVVVRVKRRRDDPDLPETFKLPTKRRAIRLRNHLPTFDTAFPRDDHETCTHVNSIERNTTTNNNTITIKNHWSTQVQPFPSRTPMENQTETNDSSSLSLENLPSSSSSSIPKLSTMAIFRKMNDSSSTTTRSTNTKRKRKIVSLSQLLTSHKIQIVDAQFAMIQNTENENDNETEENKDKKERKRIQDGIVGLEILQTQQVGIPIRPWEEGHVNTDNSSHLLFHHLLQQNNMTHDRNKKKNTSSHPLRQRMKHMALNKNGRNRNTQVNTATATATTTATTTITNHSHLHPIPSFMNRSSKPTLLLDPLSRRIDTSLCELFNLSPSPSSISSSSSSSSFLFSFSFPSSATSFSASSSASPFVQHLQFIQSNVSIPSKNKTTLKTKINQSELLHKEYELTKYFNWKCSNGSGTILHAIVLANCMEALQYCISLSFSHSYTMTHTHPHDTIENSTISLFDFTITDHYGRTPLDIATLLVPHSHGILDILQTYTTTSSTLTTPTWIQSNPDFPQAQTPIHPPRTHSYYIHEHPNQHESTSSSSSSQDNFTYDYYILDPNHSNHRTHNNTHEDPKDKKEKIENENLFPESRESNEDRPPHNDPMQTQKEDDSSDVRSDSSDSCPTLELQGGVGYWNESGELVMETEGSMRKKNAVIQNGILFLDSDNGDENLYDNHDDDDECDSNHEDYEGNDYPEEEEEVESRDNDSFCRESDPDDDEDDYGRHRKMYHGTTLVGSSNFHEYNHYEEEEEVMEDYRGFVHEDSYFSCNKSIPSARNYPSWKSGGFYGVERKYAYDPELDGDDVSEND